MSAYAKPKSCVEAESIMENAFRKSCVEAESIMENAFRQHGFPHSRVQELFGVDMSETDAKGNPSTMTIGALVYNCWITIREQQSYCRRIVQTALIQDNLPILFRFLLDQLPWDSCYTEELKCRNLQDIKWMSVWSCGEPPFPTEIKIIENDTRTHSGSLPLPIANEDMGRLHAFVSLWEAIHGSFVEIIPCE